MRTWRVYYYNTATDELLDVTIEAHRKAKAEKILMDSEPNAEIRYTEKESDNGLPWYDVTQ